MREVFGLSAFLVFFKSLLLRKCWVPIWYWKERSSLMLHVFGSHSFDFRDEEYLVRLEEMEEEHDILNTSLMTLSTHFAQVQFRLKQISLTEDMQLKEVGVLGDRTSVNSNLVAVFRWSLPCYWAGLPLTSFICEFYRGCILSFCRFKRLAFFRVPDVLRLFFESYCHRCWNNHFWKTISFEIPFERMLPRVKPRLIRTIWFCKYCFQNYILFLSLSVRVTDSWVGLYRMRQDKWAKVSTCCSLTCMRTKTVSSAFHLELGTLQFHRYGLRLNSSCSNINKLFRNHRNFSVSWHRQIKPPRTTRSWNYYTFKANFARAFCCEPEVNWRT